MKLTKDITTLVSPIVIDKELVACIMEHNNLNYTQIAELIGIHRNSLYRFLNGKMDLAKAKKRKIIDLFINENQLYLYSLKEYKKKD